MKKIIRGIFCTVLMSAMVSIPSYGQTGITIEKAMQNSTGNIEVVCNINESNENQQITVVTREQGTEGYDNSIIYINQFVPNITDDNKFTFTFAPAQWTDGNKTYIVKVGGYGIDTTDSMVLAFYEGVIYKTGDINGDGVINKEDAAELLRYVAKIKDLSEKQILAADYNGDGVSDMIDVIGILGENSEK